MRKSAGHCDRQLTPTPPAQGQAPAATAEAALREVPEMDSKSELFPELWSPITTIAGRSTSWSARKGRTLSITSSLGRIVLANSASISTTVVVLRRGKPCCLLNLACQSGSKNVSFRSTCEHTARQRSQESAARCPGITNSMPRLGAVPAINTLQPPYEYLHQSSGKIMGLRDLVCLTQQALRKRDLQRLATAVDRPSRPELRRELFVST